MGIYFLDPPGGSWEGHRTPKTAKALIPTSAKLCERTVQTYHGVPLGFCGFGSSEALFGRVSET